MSDGNATTESHGHPEPKVAWREVYLYDEKCACGCQLLSCPDRDCQAARCLHCQPLCASPKPPDDDVIVLTRPPGIPDEEWRDLIGYARVTVTLKAHEARERRG